MGESLFDKSVIVGIGQTEFSKDSGRTELQLAAEASLAAIKDAGLSPADIDGMVTFAADGNDELALMRNLGIPKIRWTARTAAAAAGPPRPFNWQPRPSRRGPQRAC